MAHEHMTTREFRGLLGPNRSPQSEAVSHIATGIYYDILNHFSNFITSV